MNSNVPTAERSIPRSAAWATTRECRALIADRKIRKSGYPRFHPCRKIHHRPAHPHPPARTPAAAGEASTGKGQVGPQNYIDFFVLLEPLQRCHEKLRLH